MSHVLLLPSPLLGPAAWGPVARELGARVADPEGATTPDSVLAAFRAAASGLRDPVLVAHSNAGLHAAALAGDVGARGVVHVDAALPSSSGGPTPMAPPGLREHLAGLTSSDGLLPPWTRWWDAGEVDSLLPDASTRDVVEAGQPRLPLAYLESVLDVPADWARTPSAYLAFGSTYAEEVALARVLGWPVVTMAGRHLHLLVDPAGVAVTIAELVEQVTT